MCLRCARDSVWIFRYFVFFFAAKFLLTAAVMVFYRSRWSDFFGDLALFGLMGQISLLPIFLTAIIFYFVVKAEHVRQFVVLSCSMLLLVYTAAHGMFAVFEVAQPDIFALYV